MQVVCLRGFLFHTTGGIYTLNDNVQNDGYGIMRQFVEDKENEWVSEGILLRDYTSVENITASVTLTWGDGREDKRYFVDNEDADAFHKDALKVISKHHRKNAKRRKPEYILENSVIEYDIEYTV